MELYCTSKMLSKTTGRSIADEVRQPSLKRTDAPERPTLELSWAHPSNGRTPLYVKRTQESLFGDIGNLDVNARIKLAFNRVEWKANRPCRRCEPHTGEYAEYNTIQGRLVWRRRIEYSCSLRIRRILSSMLQMATPSTSVVHCKDTIKVYSNVISDFSKCC